MKRTLLTLIVFILFIKVHAQNSPVGLKFDETQLVLSTGTSVINDATADGGNAIYKPSTAPNNSIWFGPYAHLQGGNYLVQFRLKVSSNTSSSFLFGVDIVDGYGATVYATLSITPNMFRNSNEWQLFTVPVSIPNTNSIVEIRGMAFQTGITDVYLDYVNIIPGDVRGFYSNELAVTGTGNVGIGIANPQEKLAVNGTVHSKKVIVDLVGWPDYVFKNDYKLMPLAQVKSYIDQNQHLPGLPSDKEVESKGLDVGEMNKLLTKKVEELTLYLIDLKTEKDKKESALEVANKEQKEQLEKLSKRLEILEKKQ